MRLTGYLSKRSAAFLITLAIIAAGSSLALFEYSSSVSTSISNQSLANVNSNTQIQANDLSHLLSRTLEGISENLQVIAAANSVQSNNVTSSVSLFWGAQNSTDYLTSDYFWMDSTGGLLLVSNGNITTYPPGTGKNLSQRQYFTVPEETGTTYFSSATPALTNSSNIFIFISQPVFSESRFDGVVSAAIQLDTLGNFLQSDLTPTLRSSVGILDFNGTVLYTGNESLIGQSVFGSSFQSELPSVLKPTFDSFLNESLSGNSGVDDISYKGVTGTLAYQPVFVNDSTGRPHQFGVLYIATADTLAGSAVALINQQRFVSTAILIAIGATFFGTAFMILRWNKRLGDAVREKTKELVSTNLQLSSANELLASQSKAQADLINIAAHELRTPTQSILANAELLHGAIVPQIEPIRVSSTPPNGKVESGEKFISFPKIPQEDVVELVESTFRNALRLERLTQTLLEVARIDNRTLRLDYETFDLNELIKQLIPDFKSSSTVNISSQYPKLEISLSTERKDLILTTDKTKVGQILSNLIGNAIKSSRGGGKIVVSTRTDDKYAMISVKDEGRGIDKEMLPRLFNKFVTDSGTGLGLFISKSYVEALDGSISAENKDGKGATFTFTLPLHPTGFEDPPIMDPPTKSKMP